MKNPGRMPDHNWQDANCPGLLPRALWLTLLAMLANLPAMVRYVRTGREPS